MADGQQNLFVHATAAEARAAVPADPLEESAARRPVPSGTVMADTPADLDVAAIVAALAVGEVRPWDRVVPGCGAIYVDKTCVWSGPLELLPEWAARYDDAKLALHPDDFAKLPQRRAA